MIISSGYFRITKGISVHACILTIMADSATDSEDEDYIPEGD